MEAHYDNLDVIFDFCSDVFSSLAPLHPNHLLVEVNAFKVSSTLMKTQVKIQSVTVLAYDYL